MKTFLDCIHEARTTGNLDPVVDAIPYAKFLGFSADTSTGELIGKMAYGDHLIGNAMINALHGGTLGALLETTAIFKLLWEAETFRVPKIVNITVEYLRSGRPMDTYCKGTLTRQGRRVANVRVVAWQDDPENPIAAANAHFLLVPAEHEEG